MTEKNELSPAAINGGGMVKRNRTGLYSTPDNCVTALLNRLKFPTKSVMEPCAGEGAISRVLRGSGYHVGYQCDIDPQSDGIEKRDFFDLTENHGCDAIITNPPFKLFEQFATKGFQLGIDVQAYLLKVNTFSAASRSGFFRKHRPHFKFDLTWRPDFLNMGSPTMDCCWIIWIGEPCASSCTYDLLDKPTGTKEAA